MDEADLLAPQRLPKDLLRLLGAMDDAVRRGRAHGLGATLISQRPAVMNKDILGQAEVLIALRMTSPRDVAAIDEWIRLHADTEQCRLPRYSASICHCYLALWTAHHARSRLQQCQIAWSEDDRELVLTHFP